MGKENDQKIEMSYWTHVLSCGNHIGERSIRERNNWLTVDKNN